MALIAFLALAIMTYVRSEDRNSRAAADIIEARVLAELPEKLVISQIRRATSNLGHDHTWTSQPGMLRVFGTELEDGATRANHQALYKLYSADEMVLAVTDPKDKLDEETSALSQVNWSSDKNASKPANVSAVYADLNEPAILQPVQRQRSTQDLKQGSVVYPIIDPTANGKVDGFSINTSAAPIATIAHRFPLPVKWLYVLRDGSLCLAQAQGEDKVLIVATGDSEHPTKDNPVVARIAFWTDDEGCKLNLNTATEPAPWDAPHTRTLTDEDYAKAIPARGENYRLSGHPAFTSLAPVLRHLMEDKATVDAPKSQEPQSLIKEGATWAQHLTDWHSMFPRSFINDGNGSLGGTRDYTSEALVKQERLFATVDDFFYGTGSAASEERLRNGIQAARAPRLTEDGLRASQFFLTTHNRAPELNPFNRPKLSLWPVQADPARRTWLDKLAVRATTIGEYGYYLQRASEWESADKPGSSQDQDADSGQSAGSTERNFYLFDAMYKSSQLFLPGFGQPFVGTQKFSENSYDQLLISMFDMIRWGINPATPYSQNLLRTLTPEYSYLAPGPGQPGADTGLGGGSALPLRMTGVGPAIPTSILPPGYPGATQWVKGYGRFPTLTEVSIVFATTAVDMADGAPVNQDGHPDFADHTKKLRAFVVLEPFNVAPGVPALSPNLQYRIRNLDQLNLTLSGQNKSLQLPADTTNSVKYSPAKTQSGQSPYVGLVSQFVQEDGTPKEPGTMDDDKNFAFVSSTDIDLSNIPQTERTASTTLDFSGGTVQIQINDNRTGELVQVIEVQFPPTPIPMPMMAIKNASLVDGVASDVQMKHRFTPEKGAAATAPPRMTHLIYRGDVVRSVQLDGMTTAGDVRMLAGRNYVTTAQPIPAPPQPIQWFVPHPDYANVTEGPAPTIDIPRNYAHTLRDGSTTALLGYWENNAEVPNPAPAGGSLIARAAGSTLASILYDGKAPPATIPGAPGALNADGRPGDFDNGPGIIEDGPYINMPDMNNEANQASTPSKAGWFERGGEFKDEDGTSFNPLRQASSGFLFGSLPTGVFGVGGTNDPALPPLPPRPWQTLLLCPNPPSRTSLISTDLKDEPGWVTTNAASDKKDHFGFALPRDHLWLEFFRMPIVEPAGIADQVSTEGKVNMNYAIQPFAWVKRATAMHGALQGVRITAIPTATVTQGTSNHYKDPSTASDLQFRYGVNADATLEAFDEQRFEQGDVFRSPSEICEMWLVPQRLKSDVATHLYNSGNIAPAKPPGNDRQPSEYAQQKTGDYKEMLTWWEKDVTKPDDAFEATGDNLRESPYAQLYPRLATRSNVFTVHYRVQVLRKSRSTKPSEWVEGQDTVAAEQRGSTTLERFLDPNQTTPAIPDYATNPDAPALDDFYKLRIINRRVFAP